MLKFQTVLMFILCLSFISQGADAPRACHKFYQQEYYLSKNIEATLKYGSISKREFRRLPPHVVEILTFENGMEGVFKRQNANGRENYLAEVAAYKISRILGLQIVPPTVFRTIDGIRGSLQLFVPGRPAHHKWNKYDLRFAELNILDYLIFNPDRHNRNLLLTKNLVFAIDNGAAFQNQNNFIGRFPPVALEDLHISQEQVSIYYALLDKLKPQVISNLLSGFASKTSINQVIRRRKLLLQRFENELLISRNIVK